ncbi:MAG: response regulator, partial [Candidatus Latescibacteria bacterium]|nr:response regulator [Candidatus Latescibacterota bacterium]
GEEAMASFLSAPPDIAILDIIMPKMSGIEVCQQIKDNHLLRHIPVVLATALEEQDAKLAGIEAGADEFLNKPFDLNELKARLRSLLRGKDLFDELQKRYEELNQVYREVDQKNKELESLNGLKNQFLGMAAHDLRNPLNVISNFSQFLSSDLAGQVDEEHLGFIDNIQKSSESMLNLVNDLLDISQIEAGKLNLNLARVDLQDVIVHNMTLNRLMADQKKISLTFQCKSDTTFSVVDAPKIDQVLNNLISNAIKFSQSATCIEVVLVQRDEMLVLSVKDQGQGIPEHEIPQLFQAFQKTSVKSTAGEKSTGLGLMIARKIVEGHGGKIWVESKSGHGSTFTFTLPLRQEDMEAQLDVAPVVSQKKVSLKVLVAEDNVVNRQIVTRILEKAGHEVVAVEDGEQALQATESQAFDLVLMDSEMPKMDGVTCTRNIRRREQDTGVHLPIVALTAHAGDGDREHFLSVGMDDYLTKPVQPEALFLVIQNLGGTESVADGA